MGAPTESGRVIAGRYRLAEPLGSGGMGTVWLARDELLHRQVAVKEVFPPAGVSDDEREMLRERTLREARTAARLSHPNVVTIYDVVEDAGQPWIVMELIQARSLREIVEADGPLAAGPAARVGLQLLGALRAAHALGIMHRDVKPGNVLIDADGRAVLADFGIARSQDSPATTTSGVLVGSPSYIAPERAQGERGGPESDLWSLGATLYAAVEGRPPYDRDGALATLMAVVSEEPDPPGHAGPLWPVISGLLESDRTRRLGSAAAEHLLRRVAEAPGADGTAGTADADGAASGQPRHSLERAERTRAFHPPAAQPPDAVTAAAPPSGDQPPPEPSAPPEPSGPQEPAPWPAADDTAEAGLPSRLAPAGELPAIRRVRPRPRRTWLIAAAALVVAAGVAAGLYAADRPAAGTSARSGHPPGQTATAPASPTSAVSATPRPHSRSASAASTSAASTPGPDAGSRAPVPAGYRTYHDPTGFSIAVPDGWQISHRGAYVYLTQPSGAAFLLIDQSDQPKPDPLADWRQQEANRIGTYPGYHRVRLEAISYPQAEKAADWEFTYYRQGVLLHVLNRNVLANAHHAYALYWSTSQSDWASEYGTFKVLARTFQPASP